jgi:hypothetical protein
VFPTIAFRPEALVSGLGEGAVPNTLVKSSRAADGSTLRRPHSLSAPYRRFLAAAFSFAHAAAIVAMTSRPLTVGTVGLQEGELRVPSRAVVQRAATCSG